MSLGTLAQVNRYWETVRHLRWRQVLSRITLKSSAALRHRWPGLSAAVYSARLSKAGLRPSARGLGLRRLRPSDITHDDNQLAHSRRIAAAVSAGRFCYLNVEARLGRPVDWAAPHTSQLWRYHLHYCEELPVVALTDPGAALQVIDEWIAAHPAEAGASDPWHPYVVCVRCLNWMLVTELAIAHGLAVPPHIFEAIARHALFVRHNLEYDGGGNHVLRNFKTLLFAGMYFDGVAADAWFRESLDAIKAEVAKQVLADGAHYQRSPMYHCQVTTDLLEIAAVVAVRERSIPTWLAGSVESMVKFLDVICHPDGDIALLKDSAFGIMNHPDELRAFKALLVDGVRGASLTPLHAAFGLASGAPVSVDGAASQLTPNKESSQYLRLDSNDGSLMMIVDGGKVCPDDLPAHAHSDMMSFEASVEGRRFFVDSGVGHYVAGPWRDYWRSTRAHNTVSVDGAEQSDCWGSFRVGRRARPTIPKTFSGDGYHGWTISHDGYAHLSPSVIHTRHVAVVGDHGWVILDELHGRGHQQWASFLHAHPDATIEPASTTLFSTRRQGHTVEVRTFGSLNSARIVSGATAPLQGWYAEEFGKIQPSPTLILEGSGPLPARFGFMILAQAESAFEMEWEDRDPARLTVRLSNAEWRINFPGVTH